MCTGCAAAMKPLAFEAAGKITLIFMAMFGSSAAEMMQAEIGMEMASRSEVAKCMKNGDKFCGEIEMSDEDSLKMMDFKCGALDAETCPEGCKEQLETVKTTYGDCAGPMTEVLVYTTSATNVMLDPDAVKPDVVVSRLREFSATCGLEMYSTKYAAEKKTFKNRVTGFKKDYLDDEAAEEEFKALVRAQAAEELGVSDSAVESVDISFDGDEMVVAVSVVPMSEREASGLQGAAPASMEMDLRGVPDAALADPSKGLAVTAVDPAPAPTEIFSAASTAMASCSVVALLALATIL